MVQQLRISNTQLAAGITIALYAVLIMVMQLNGMHPTITAAGTTTVGFVGVVIEGVCNFALEQNWNYISFCADPLNKTVASIMSQADGKYDYILMWNETSQAYDMYSIYAVQNPFTEVNVTKSYFIHVNTSMPSFGISGIINKDMNLSLINKWNAPSYPYEFAANVSHYLNTIAGNYEYMLKWNNSAQAYNLYSIYAIDQPFAYIYKGEGQFIYVNATSTVLVYNRTVLP